MKVIIRFSNITYDISILAEKSSAFCMLLFDYCNYLDNKIITTDLTHLGPYMKLYLDILQDDQNINKINSYPCAYEILKISDEYNSPDLTDDILRKFKTEKLINNMLKIITKYPSSFKDIYTVSIEDESMFVRENILWLLYNKEFVINKFINIPKSIFDNMKIEFSCIFQDDHNLQEYLNLLKYNKLCISIQLPDIIINEDIYNIITNLRHVKYIIIRSKENSFVYKMLEN